MWKNQYRLIWIADEGTRRIEVRLPLWSWVAALITFLLILWAIFAYTPLRYTVPGYPTRSFRQKYNQLVQRLQAIEQKLAQQTATIEELRTLNAVMRANPQPPTLPLIPTLQSGQYMLPAEGQISRRFQPSRDHWGLDITCNAGDPVLAIAEGVVIFSEYSYESGYVIGIQHPNGLVSLYKHNSRLMRRVGEKVRGGDVIALAGGLGAYSTAPHLHIETWLGSFPVDPLKLLAYE
ncbi:MAG: M23 family metallopeptidase [Bacteroidia bacterium]|nr:M23 family metallopeptidase [Bacteroidia bacterium]MCX7652272.1 M23 family metallopeptidase [Bacteroidia bacterium]MDW8416534.1 M23 family metallopeptidase [Bacteroidia bacterium]